MNFIPSFAVIILLYQALFLLWKHSDQVLSKTKVVFLSLSITLYQLAVMPLYLFGLYYINIIVIEIVATAMLVTLELMFCEIARLQLRHQGNERSTSED